VIGQNCFKISNADPNEPRCTCYKSVGEQKSESTKSEQTDLWNQSSDEMCWVNIS